MTGRLQRLQKILREMHGSTIIGIVASIAERYRSTASMIMVYLRKSTGMVMFPPITDISQQRRYQYYIIIYIIYGRPTPSIVHPVAIGISQEQGGVSIERLRTFTMEYGG